MRGVGESMDLFRGGTILIAESGDRFFKAPPRYASHL